MKVSVISVFLSVAITDTRSPLSLLSAFIIKENNMFQLELNGKFFPSQFFPITDTLNSIYKLGHQVETIYFFLPVCHSLQYLSSLIRVWTWATTEKELSPNHWATREFPRPYLRSVLVEPSSDPWWHFLMRVRPGYITQREGITCSLSMWPRSSGPGPVVPVGVCGISCQKMDTWREGAIRENEREEHNLKMGKGQERRVWSNFLKLG